MSSKGWKWHTKSHANWAEKVTYELIEIRQRIEAIEARLTGVGVGAVEGRRTRRDVPEIREVETIYTERKTGLEDLRDIEAPMSPEDTRTLTQDFIEFTTQARMATISLRGYLMLADQMGLSRDQKHAIRELEQTMLMFQKLIVTIKLLHYAYQALTAAEMGPMGIFYLAMAGGTMSASLAYSAKVASAN